MTSERIFPSGGWLVSDLIGGSLVSRRYLGISKREALRMFRNEFRNGSPRIPRHETVKGHPIRCYDNGGRSADRYTVIYMDAPEHRPGTFGARGMDDRPFHPQGFGMYCDAMPGRHIGRRVLFSTLPPDCQRAVLQDLTPTA